MDSIGFIGLGVMGRPMALNLPRAGHTLSAFARKAERARRLAEAGASARARVIEPMAGLEG